MIDFPIGNEAAKMVIFPRGNEPQNRASFTIWKSSICRFAHSTGAFSILKWANGRFSNRKQAKRPPNRRLQVHFSRRGEDEWTSSAWSGGIKADTRGAYLVLYLPITRCFDGYILLVHIWKMRFSLKKPIIFWRFALGKASMGWFFGGSGKSKRT